jgi:Tol biopolymer transport system component
VRQRWLWPAAAAIAGALLTALVLWLARGEPAGEPPVRASIVPAPGTNFAVRDITGTPHFALSPDGQWIVFAAHAPGETPRLWLRSLSSVEPRPLPGTEDAGGPFWSPDSRHVAFFARRRLKRIALDGGSIQELAEVNFDVTGGTWSPDGVIVFGGPSNDGFYRIAANGGPTERATRLLEERGETGHRWPRFLPGGQSFLFYIRSDKPGVSGVYVGQVGSDARKQIIESRASATFVEPNYVLSDRNGTLMAYPFDLKTMELRGEPLPLDDRLSAQMGPSHLPLEGSANGTLAYWNGLGPVTRLEWHDRSGRLLRQVGVQAHQFSPELSHDGTRLLVTRRIGAMHNELWSADLAADAWSRVTFSPAGARFGVWSADAQRIIYSSLAQNGSRLYERDASGAGQERVIFDPRSWAVFPVDWSHDGQWLVYSASTANAWDVGAVRARDGARRAVVAGPSNEIQGQVSPNDRWLAYVSDESGTWEVYVTAFPSGEGKWQVSTEGGSQPRWSPDGKELFYLAEDGTLMSAAIRSTGAFAASPPRPLFRTRALRTVAPFRIGYAVGPNGDFLITSVVSEAVEPITIVHNWTAALASQGR